MSKCCGCIHSICILTEDKFCKPSGKPICCICRRHPQQKEVYNMIKSWYKWWDMRGRISVWRLLRPSKLKDRYVHKKNS